MIRYDFDRLESVAIYHPNGEFLCFAPEYCPNGGVHPAAKLLGTAGDVAAYKEAAKLKNGLHRATRKEVKQVILGAAAAGFGQLVQEEVMPDLLRKQERINQALPAKKTGTHAVDDEFADLPTQQEMWDYENRQIEKQRAQRAARERELYGL